MLRKIKKDGLAKTHKKSLEVVNSYCGDLDLIETAITKSRSFSSLEPLDLI